MLYINMHRRPLLSQLFWFKHIRQALTEKHVFVAVIQCGPPPQVHHGKVEGTDHSWGAGVSYSCFHGYQQSTPAVLTCEGNGTWTGDVPQCLRKLASRCLLNRSHRCFLFHGVTSYKASAVCVCVCVSEAGLCGDPGSPGGGYREGNIFSYRSVVWCYHVCSLLRLSFVSGPHGPVIAATGFFDASCYSSLSFERAVFFWFIVITHANIPALFRWNLLCKSVYSGSLQKLNIFPFLEWHFSFFRLNNGLIHSPFYLN